MKWEYWDGKITNQLQKLVEEKKHGIAVFDFDNTLIFGDQGINLMNFLISNFLIKIHDEWFWEDSHWKYIEISKKEELRRLLNDDLIQNKSLFFLDKIWDIFESLEKKSLEIAYRWTKIFFAGFKAKELEDYSLLSFQRALIEKEKYQILPSGRKIERKIGINQVLQELVEFLTHKKWQVYIITASPQIAIQAISHYWNVDKSNVFGMVLKKDHGTLLPEIVEPFTYNIGKYLVFKNHVKDEIDIAVGDSYPDIEILRNARLPIFIKRNNEELNNYAKSMNFFIQDFSYLLTNA